MYHFKLGVTDSFQLASKIYTNGEFLWQSSGVRTLHSHSPRVQAQPPGLGAKIP